MQHTNSDNPDKDKGTFICEKITYFKADKKRDGAPHLPKVTVGGKEIIICMKRSSKDKVCTNSQCKFAHIFTLKKITKGVNKLNTWTVAMNGVTWSSPAVTAAAAKAKPVVLNEDTGKNDK